MSGEGLKSHDKYVMTIWYGDLYLKSLKLLHLNASVRKGKSTFDRDACRNRRAAYNVMSLIDVAQTVEVTFQMDGYTKNITFIRIIYSLNYNFYWCPLVSTQGALETLFLSCQIRRSTKSKTEHTARINSAPTCYLGFVWTISPKDVVVSCRLIVACCIHASAASLEHCVNMWDWKPALSQLLIPFVEVTKSQPH